jgi:hypothetical protein
MANLHGHGAGNGGHSQGEPTDTAPVLDPTTAPTIRRGPAQRGQTRTSIANTRRLLFTQINSWMTGINTNVGGKQKRTVLVYAGGAPAYRKRCDEVAAKGYAGFVFEYR